MGGGQIDPHSVLSSDAFDADTFECFLHSVDRMVLLNDKIQHCTATHIDCGEQHSESEMVQKGGGHQKKSQFRIPLPLLQFSFSTLDTYVLQLPRTSASQVILQG